MYPRILLIKLAALGDVLRTTTLLWGLKEVWPTSYILWLTLPEAIPLLEGIKQIDELVPFDVPHIIKMQAQEFDILINLDKAKEAAALAKILKAKEKKGFLLSETGNIYPCNKESEYAFLLGLCDELKMKKNTKTYPELIYEMVGIPYKKQPYVFFLPEEEKFWAKNFLREKGVEKSAKIGFNLGGGENFANKGWTLQGFISLAQILKEEGFQVLSFGGERERERTAELKRKAPFVIDTGIHSIKRFAALINECDVLVTGDSLGMHIGIALEKKVVALFGSTCAQEIELYGRGEKIVSNMDCAPCYKKACEKKPSCMDEIKAEEVFLAIKKVYGR